jgi:hypothetical protein
MDAARSERNAKAERELEAIALWSPRPQHTDQGHLRRVQMGWLLRRVMADRRDNSADSDLAQLRPIITTRRSATSGMAINSLPRICSLRSSRSISLRPTSSQFR